jgi:type IV fimbrial biogenesis protein FimT
MSESIKNGAGFTLVEMVIAVAIIAILLAAGMPSFQTFIENTKIRGATENMQAGLHLARMEAMRRNARVSLWMVNGLTSSCARSNSGTSWVVSQENPAGSCNAASSDTTSPRLIQSRSGSDGSTNINVSALDSANAASSCITFNGFGRVESACTGGDNPITRITFASPSSSTRSLEVRIPTGGAVRMCDPSASTGSATAC